MRRYGKIATLRQFAEQQIDPMKRSRAGAIARVHAEDGRWVLLLLGLLATIAILLVLSHAAPAQSAMPRQAATG